MIGSACGAVISIGTGVEAYSIGVGGLPGILSIKPQFWLNSSSPCWWPSRCPLS